MIRIEFQDGIILETSVKVSKAERGSHGKYCDTYDSISLQQIDPLSFLLFF